MLIAYVSDERYVALPDVLLELEGDAGSMHVLNAVSPGFTCAPPFAAHVCDQILAGKIAAGH